METIEPFSLPILRMASPSVGSPGQCITETVEDGTTRTYTLTRKYVSKEQHCEYMKRYQKKRYQTDPEYREAQLKKAKERYHKNKARLEELETLKKSTDVV
jgi:UTP:GlnB (protein PII) uridylyltransferase